MKLLVLALSLSFLLTSCETETTGYTTTQFVINGKVSLKNPDLESTGSLSFNFSYQPIYKDGEGGEDAVDIRENRVNISDIKIAKDGTFQAVQQIDKSGKSLIRVKYFAPKNIKLSTNSYIDSEVHQIKPIEVRYEGIIDPNELDLENEDMKYIGVSFQEVDWGFADRGADVIKACNTIKASCTSARDLCYQRKPSAAAARACGSISTQSSGCTNAYNCISNAN